MRTATLNPEKTMTPEKTTTSPPVTPDEVNNEPIKFSTSAGSHHTWKVDRTMGIQYQRPWWKVLPVSLAALGFLLWCAFREETEIDTMLEKDLYEHLPGLLPEANRPPPPGSPPAEDNSTAE